MSTSTNIENTIFTNYKPIIYKLNKKNSKSIIDSSFDVLLSNNIAYPELRLGFQHFIHASKDKMELTEKFANRKKVYLVTSLFEKNIDKKDITNSNIPYISIDMGLKEFIKNNINSINTISNNIPEILSRAFLKLWEMIIYFDLIPSTDNFISAHIAEGPGSFIQATILYRDLLAKIKKIKTSKNDKYYAVTLHSDNEHLLIEKSFLNYYNNEKPQRLHILETINKKDIKGGSINSNKDIKIISDGDITKLQTINLFGGASTSTSAHAYKFAEPAYLITADGGFDWKKENLQEQEAYRLIFGQIVTALKIQQNEGNFVIKIFETYTINSLKLIELLREFYEEVYICKPFTSRISNSEKYLICKIFNKKKFTTQIAKKLEDMILVMNKNEQFNIIELFSEFKLDKELFDQYKNINIELTLKQFIGINNIVKFINLENYNGVEYNEYLDKQIEASRFWVNTFLEINNYNKINNIIKKYDFMNLDNYVKSSLTRQQYNTSMDNGILTKSNKSNKSNKLNKFIKSTKIKNQKGGNNNNDSDIEIEIDYDNELTSTNSTNSNDEYINKVIDILDKVDNKKQSMEFAINNQNQNQSEYEVAELIKTKKKNISKSKIKIIKK